MEIASTNQNLKRFLREAIRQNRRARTTLLKQGTNPLLSRSRALVLLPPTMSITLTILAFRQRPSSLPASDRMALSQRKPDQKSSPSACPIRLHAPNHRCIELIVIDAKSTGHSQSGLRLRVRHFLSSSAWISRSVSAYRLLNSESPLPALQPRSNHTFSKGSTAPPVARSSGVPL